MQHSDPSDRTDGSVHSYCCQLSFSRFQRPSSYSSSQSCGNDRRWLVTKRWFTVGPTVLAGVLVFAVLVPVLVIPVFFLARGFNNSHRHARKHVPQRTGRISRASNGTLRCFDGVHGRVLLRTRHWRDSSERHLAGFGGLAVIVLLVSWRVRIPSWNAHRTNRQDSGDGFDGNYVLRLYEFEI